MAPSVLVSWRGGLIRLGRSVGLVFFFSSRRRHTRLVSDWSSDVCSSDLRLVADGVFAQPTRMGAEISSTRAICEQRFTIVPPLFEPREWATTRSRATP